MKQVVSLSLAFVMVASNANVAFAAGENEQKAQARAVYDGAALAYSRGDFFVAAQEFSRADAMQPNDIVLGQALEAATRAGSAALAMNLVERTHAREGVSADVVARADMANAAFATKASKIVIKCDACDELEIDNAKVESKGVWVDPGPHVVEMHRGTHIDRLELHPTEGVTLEAIAPPLPKAPMPVYHVVRVSADKRPFSPIVFYAAAGVTAALGGLTIASAVDTRAKHTAFEGNPTDAMGDAGASAQVRTNFLVGATAVALVSTAALGIFAVHWGKKDEKKQVGLSISPSFVSVGGQFQ